MLEWVAAHQLGLALDFSVSCIDEAPVGEPQALQRAALALVG